MATTDTKLYAAIGILAVLGGALYLSNKKEKEEAQAYSLSGRSSELPKIEISDEEIGKITKIALRKPAKDGAAAVDVTLVKKGEEWRLEQPADALANQANVKSLLDNLKSLKVSETIDSGKASYEKYKVSDELAVHAVFSKEGGVVLDAYFGENGGRGQMTRIAGKDGVYAVKGYSDYLYARDVKGWRDLTLFKFEEGDVTAVDVQNEHGSFNFAKDGETWTAKHKAPKGEKKTLDKFDSAKVLDMVRAYRMLNADNFAEKGKTEADLGLATPVASATFTLKDGGKREIKLGSTAEGSSRWVTVSGKPEIFSISSWAADWGTADQKKFQKEEKKPGDAAAPPGGPPGGPGMPGMPGGMPEMDPHGH